MSSTPGYCVLTRLGTTNGEILGWDGQKCDDERLEFVRSMTRHRFERLLRGELEADNLKVFVKQEAHKVSKLKEGRFRLIQAVSLVDTMLDRVLFGWLGRSCLASVGKTPCLVGWAPLRGGWRELQARFTGKRVVCIDKSAWDWTVPDWLVDMWFSFITELAYNPAEWWIDMVGKRFKLLFEEARFQFEDGTVVEQGLRGVMKSGCYLTILLNSVSQSMLHYLANWEMGVSPTFRQPFTMGDDTVQETPSDLLRYAGILERFGFKLKGVKVQNWIEFAGFAYTGKTCFPAYWAKHLYNLGHTEALKEVLVSYQYLWAHEPEMSAYVRRVAAAVDVRLVLPRRIVLDVFDG